MQAREWFESIRDRLGQIEKAEQRIAQLKAAAGPKGQRFGSIGGGGSSHDGMAKTDAAMDLERELVRMRASVQVEIEQATDVLYGRSGRGGLAKALSSTDADCLLGYYLQHMSWRAVASELVQPHSDYPKQWCQQRAARALAYIDRVGIAALADS